MLHVSNTIFEWAVIWCIAFSCILHINKHIQYTLALNWSTANVRTVRKLIFHSRFTCKWSISTFIELRQIFIYNILFILHMLKRCVLLVYGLRTILKSSNTTTNLLRVQQHTFSFAFCLPNSYFVFPFSFQSNVVCFHIRCTKTLDTLVLYMNQL